MDAGRDAGSDAGRWGEGTCATGRLGDGGFVPFEWTPDGCVIEHATAPSEVLGQLCWQPCRDGRAGCSELVKHWREPQVLYMLQTYSNGAHDGTHGYFRFMTAVDAAGTLRIIARDDGRITSVWRDLFPARHDACFSAAAAIGPTHAAIVVQDHGLTSLRILFDRLEALADRTTLTATLDRTFTGMLADPDSTGISDRFFVLEQGGAGSLTRTSLAGETLVIGRANADGLPGRPIVVHGDSFYTEYRSDQRWRAMVVHTDGTGGVFRAIPDGAVELYGADEREMVWFEERGHMPTSEPRWSRVEIWHGRFTASPSELRPERVVRVGELLPGSSYGTLGFGHFIYRSARDVVRDVDLTTGNVYEVHAPAGMDFKSDAAYSGPDDFLIEIEPKLLSAPTGTLLRYRHDSLGPAITLNGGPVCLYPGCDPVTCPPRGQTCASWAPLEGTLCDPSAVLDLQCVCAGDDRCLWECQEDGRFHQAGDSCSALGISTDFE